MAFARNAIAWVPERTLIEISSNGGAGSEIAPACGHGTPRTLPAIAAAPMQSPARSSCTCTFDRDIFQASPNELPAIDIHSL